MVRSLRLHKIIIPRITQIGFEDENFALQPSSIQEDEDVTEFEKRVEEWLIDYYCNK